MPETGAALPGRVVWSVAALVHALADALVVRFCACAGRGEISGFSRAASGHCYFGLKDAEGRDVLIRRVMFRRASALLDFSPAEGQQVEVHGASRFPRRVSVVTSLAAAALRDVATALARRAPQVELIVYPSSVQGGEAPRSNW